MNQIAINQRLYQQVAATCPLVDAPGLPSFSVGTFGVSGSVTFNPAPSATQQQITAAQAIINGFVWADRTMRTLFAIRTDIVALSASQKTNIWTALTTGTPPLIATDTGPNQGTIFLLWRLAQLATLSTADITEMKIDAATYYVQDNPRFLVNPSFDATINIAGDQ